MYSTVTTTITTEIDLDTFEPTHRVGIDAGDGLPEDVVVAAALGGCRAAAKSLERR